MLTKLRRIDLLKWEKGMVVRGPLPLADNWFAVESVLAEWEYPIVKEADDFITRITTVFP